MRMLGRQGRTRTRDRHGAAWIAVALFLAAAITVTAVIAWNHKGAFRELQPLVTVAGAAAALLYFGYRFIAGEFFTGMAITVVADRKAAGGGNDLLSITVKLSNERSASLQLYSAAAIVRTKDSSFTVTLGDGFYRYETTNSKLNESQPFANATIAEAASRPVQASLSDFLVNPKDSITIVGIAAVEADAPVIVDVVIVGRAYVSFVETQWVSSAVALPIPPAA